MWIYKRKSVLGVGTVGVCKNTAEMFMQLLMKKDLQNYVFPPHFVLPKHPEYVQMCLTR